MLEKTPFPISIFPRTHFTSIISLHVDIENTLLNILQLNFTHLSTILEQCITPIAHFYAYYILKLVFFHCSIFSINLNFFHHIHPFLKKKKKLQRSPLSHTHIFHIFEIITLFHKASSYFHFTNRAKLNNSRSLTPKPPHFSFFGRYS